MAGIDLRAVQDLGGWISLALVQRHAHVASATRVDAVPKIAKFFHMTHDSFHEVLK